MAKVIWSPQDEEILLTKYSSLPISELKELLSAPRSTKAIDIHAQRLGLCRRSSKTSQDDRVLQAINELNVATAAELSFKTKICEVAVNMVMRRLRKRGLAHVSRRYLGVKRGMPCRFFLYRAGPGVDAAEWEPVAELPKVANAVPPRDEITAALFGIAPEVNFSPVPSRIYQQS
ncbi:hypothetical protein [Burkholderia gladioli]